jgi:hypothetical protein
VWSENYRCKIFSCQRALETYCVSKLVNRLDPKGIDFRLTARHPKLALAKLRRAKDGGEYRARTGDLLVANQALSQLS